MKRDATPIKIWLLQQGLTQAAVARRAGVSLPNVSMTVHGHRHNPRVLRVLLDLGVPPSLLAPLPENVSTGPEV